VSAYDGDGSHPWDRGDAPVFVALGDSFTEGLDDRRADGTYRGWADRLAESLAVGSPGLTYANLAVRGRLLRQIVDEQVDAALALEPSLVALAGGGNDILRPGCDPVALGELFASAIERLRSGGATVVAFAGFDPRRLPLGGRLSRRAITFNAEVRAAARVTPGVVLVDLWSMGVLDDPRMWAPDRLHLSSHGHERVAARVLEQLDRESSLDWRAPLPPAAPTRWTRRRLDDAEWGARYLVPWVGRRLRRRSSGQGLTAKVPVPGPVHPGSD
jgi:lysophospholipase L1-like esterase